MADTFELTPYGKTLAETQKIFHRRRSFIIGNLTQDDMAFIYNKGKSAIVRKVTATTKTNKASKEDKK